MCIVSSKVKYFSYYILYITKVMVVVSRKNNLKSIRLLEHINGAICGKAYLHV